MRPPALRLGFSAVLLAAAGGCSAFVPHQEPLGNSWEDPELSRLFDEINARVFDGKVKAEVYYFNPMAWPHSIYDGLTYDPRARERPAGGGFKPHAIYIKAAPFPFGPLGNPAYLRSVLTHEMIHAIAPARAASDPHGPEFQKLRDQAQKRSDVWIQTGLAAPFY